MIGLCLCALWFLLLKRPNLHRFAWAKKALEQRALFGIQEDGRMKPMGGKQDDITVVVGRIVA